MRLNPDCIRDILLSVEQTTGFRTMWGIKPGENMPELDGYTDDEIFYHLRQCDESGFFLDSYWTAPLAFRTKDLSPKGHEFLADIREETVWNNVKDTSKKIGVGSLKALVSVASNVVSSLISGYFNS